MRQKKSDAMFLRSNDALNDFNNYAPRHVEKVGVIPFVLQPEESYLKLDEGD